MVLDHLWLSRPSSFWAVKCAPGFQCVSKLTSFPPGHDGIYHQEHGVKSMEPTDPDRFRDWLQTYEAARGKLSPAGKCKDDGSPAEEQGYCFSASGFEAGPGQPCQEPDECLCVKADSPYGKLSLGHTRLENEEGKELLEGTYQVQEVTKCDVCEDLSFDRRHCEECENCVFKTKTLEGELVEGCWPKDGGSARRTHLLGKGDRIFLHGMPVEMKDMTIVPHYNMWDPGEAADPVGDEDSREVEDQLATANLQGPRMPYQSRREPLSRDGWLTFYKNVAPRVQQEMDKVAQNTIEAGEKAGLAACEHKLGHRLGADIPGRIEKAAAVQNACLQMQETANRIAVADANTGFARIGGIKCTMNDRVSEPGECDYLNCYATNARFKKAILALKKRNDECYEATQDSEANTCLPGEGQAQKELKGPRLPMGAAAPKGAAKPLSAEALGAEA
ncbi:unnamed protein product, partial [Effrenium voratum]